MSGSQKRWGWLVVAMLASGIASVPTLDADEPATDAARTTAPRERMMSGNAERRPGSPEGGRFGRGPLGGGQFGNGQLGAGQARPGGMRPGMESGQPGPGGDPARMVEMLMRQFDKDGDQKLNATELEGLLTMMRQRMGGAMGGPGAGGPMMREGGPMGMRRGAGANEEPGGVTPKRPPAAPATKAVEDTRVGGASS